MGKVEKIVVLSVLFLIVLILAISLNSPPNPLDRDRALMAELGGSSEMPVHAERALEKLPSVGLPGDEELAVEEPEADEFQLDPAPRADELIAQAELPGEPLELEPAQPTERPGASTIPATSPGRGGLQARPEEASAPGLLSSRVTPAVPLQESWDLLTTEGMSATRLDTLLVYTCKPGETFESLATRFYGAAESSRVLRTNNEGVDQPAAGDEILVPVNDDSGNYYLVTQNDSLWGIASKHYGDGSRWREIFEANRNVLAQPEDLVPGMELTLP